MNLQSDVAAQQITLDTREWPVEQRTDVRLEAGTSYEVLKTSGVPNPYGSSPCTIIRVDNDQYVAATQALEVATGSPASCAGDERPDTP